ncbi:MAG: hypothetical protein FRX49_02288 [Trebouxia sp. A1-2]|nr:MAG: hypothetical protein FRX49_02288 [Trebouxia sp. A1-2]
MQSDLVPSRPESATEEAAAPAKDVTKERIILELSKSNERLEKELHQLQQHLLLVKHAAHQHGVEHSSKLGSMLYDNDVAFVAESNSTDVRSASWQDAAVSGAADQLSDAHAQGLDVQNVKTCSTELIEGQDPKHTSKTAYFDKPNASQHLLMVYQPLDEDCVPRKDI